MERRALSDRSLNSFVLGSSTMSIGGSISVQRPPLPPTAPAAEKRKSNNSPVRRPPPATPRSAAALKVSRRRSNIGPMRMEKARRRSSLRPPTHADEGAYLGESASAPVTGMRRAPMGSVDAALAARNLKSPAKKKRMSLLSLASKGMGYSSRVRPAVRASLATVPPGDTSSSADVSSRTAKPLWR